MGQVLHDIGSAYQEGIVGTGKQPELFLLLAFLLSFGFIRTSAHLIRAEVSWWLGNVEVGGADVHDLLLIVGYLGIALEPDTPWREVIAILFGVGAGLTLDEFALWLNLEDVYWSEKGRQSIDAVVVTVCLLTITLLGLSFWID